MITVICIMLFAILTLLDLILLMFYELADWMIRTHRKIRRKRRKKYEEMVMDFTGSSADRTDAGAGDIGRNWFEEIK